MCGFSGFIDKTSFDSNSFEILYKMGDSIAHRGPDDEGIWTMRSRGLGLVHRRLSVLDLSIGGHQPMSSASGRYVIAYNGEIYNYKSLRSELEKRGQKFLTESDTEVLLSVIESYGLNQGLKRLAGMFAFALVDRQEEVLHIVRDRMGEKPAYYGVQNGVFLFGSELKSMRLHPSWYGGVDLSSVEQMLKLSYIPSPHTIYRNISKVVPGSVVSISYTGDKLGEPVCSNWWSLEDVINRNANTYAGASITELSSELEKILTTVVAEQKIADVPLGAFLSGGIDSSLVVSILQQSSNESVRTFSIGYSELEYDESSSAERVASLLGTKHKSWIVSAKDVQSQIPSLSDIYDEPFADSSQLPTILISKLARTEVTVALSGDGGDELFGGYNRYKWAPLLLSTFGRVPMSIRQFMSGRIRNLANIGADGHLSYLEQLVQTTTKVPQYRDKLEKIARILPLNDEIEIFRELTEENFGEQLVIGRAKNEFRKLRYPLWELSSTFAEKMMNHDAITYLPDDILVKVDRASMASSLEVRVPFLDHRLVEFSAKLPISAKLFRGRTKWILRQLLSEKIPVGLVNRPKAGFAVPIGDWLRGPLLGWAEDLLSESSLAATGYLNTQLTRELWTQHIKEQKSNARILWNLLMLQSWLQKHG